MDFSLIYPLTIWILIVIAMVVGVFFAAKSEFLQPLRLKKQRQAEFKQNVALDAVGEPEPLRSLTDQEIEILKGERVKLNSWTQRVLTVVILLAILLISYVLLLPFFIKGYLSPIFLVLPIILAVAGFIISRQVGDSTYKDLRSPVFKVKGELVKKVGKYAQQGPLGSKPKVLWGAFIIRGISFESSENPQIDGYWDAWGDGDMIEVEYSPFTKHIWKIVHKASL